MNFFSDKSLSFLFLLVFALHFSAEAQTAFWGMTPYGGANNQGTVFQTDANGGALATIQDFELDGYGTRPEGGLLLASNGKLYGMTGDAVACWDGFIFEYDPDTGTYLEKHRFNGENGKRPRGHLMEAADGFIYGLTYLGGDNLRGVIFRYDMDTGEYLKLHDFQTPAGANPTGSLVQALNGKLYGMTFYGGTEGKGVLFEFDLSDYSYEPKVHFDTDLGIYPYGSLLLASNGFLYGMTYQGGKNEQGVLFEYQPDQEVYTVKFDLGNNMGANPTGSLMEASNGLLYGMTTAGGFNNFGTLFEYDFQNDIYTKKHDFNLSGYGINPDGRLTEGPNNILYGIQNQGGTNGYGVLFSFDLQTANYSPKLNLDYNLSLSVSNLTLLSNDQLYGVSTEGGVHNKGVIFEYGIAANNYVTQRNFGEVKEGRTPIGSLTEATNGQLYGTCSLGSACDKGVMIAVDPLALTVTTIDSFSNISGGVPTGKILQANDGLLYGLATNGGASDEGVIYAYDLVEGLKTVHFFQESEGKSPKGSLIQAGNGRLYGTTVAGGNFDLGVLFEYDIENDDYLALYHFNGAEGAKPTGSLLQLNNGLLYGLASAGGASDLGVLFSYSIATATYTELFSFDSTNGAMPKGGLVFKNNMLYGLTAGGGDNGRGVLFQYNLSNNGLSKKISFNANRGGEAEGNLLAASNGNLYGLCKQGGSQNLGTLFEYQPNSNTFTKKINFNQNNGSLPVGDLLETGGCLQANSPSVTAEVSPQTAYFLGTIDLSISGGTGPFSIDWNLDGLGDNDDSEDLEDLHAGTYLVIVTDANGCQTPLQVLVDSRVGTTELTDLDIEITPNPSKGRLQLAISGQHQGLQLTLVDVLGRELLTSEVEGSSVELDLGGFADGVYFLQLRREDERSVFKFVLSNHR